MGSDDAFCLKWNDFQGSITSSLGSLRSPMSSLQDVTLQCGGESVKAHRLVLALCSEWFRTVLESLPPSTPHPVLVLWDASPADMGLLCDFMYHGQVNVQQDRLPSFLALASRLEVKGLTQTSEEKEKNEESAAKVAKMEKPVATGSVVPVYDFEGDGEDISNRALVKEEEEGADADGYLESGGLDFTGSSYSQYGYQDSIGILPSDFSPKGIPSGGGECPYCQKWIQTSVKRHVEDRHLPRATPCTVCTKVFSSGNKMRAHRSYAHRQQPPTQPPITTMPIPIISNSQNLHLQTSTQSPHHQPPVL